MAQGERSMEKLHPFGCGFHRTIWTGYLHGYGFTGIYSYSQCKNSKRSAKNRRGNGYNHGTAFTGWRYGKCLQPWGQQGLPVPGSKIDAVDIRSHAGTADTGENGESSAGAVYGTVSMHAACPDKIFRYGWEKNLQPYYNKNISVMEGDIFLLCSDGLYNMLQPAKLSEHMENIKQNMPEEIASFLIEKALIAGGDDNITCMAIKALRKGSR